MKKIISVYNGTCTGIFTVKEHLKTVISPFCTCRDVGLSGKIKCRIDDRLRKNNHCKKTKYRVFHGS